MGWVWRSARLPRSVTPQSCPGRGTHPVGISHGVVLVAGMGSGRGDRWLRRECRQRERRWGGEIASEDGVVFPMAGIYLARCGRRGQANLELEPRPRSHRRHRLAPETSKSRRTTASKTAAASRDEHLPNREASIVLGDFAKSPPARGAPTIVHPFFIHSCLFFCVILIVHA